MPIRLVSWLPSEELVPPTPVSEYPANSQSVAASAMLFTIRGVLANDEKQGKP